MRRVGRVKGSELHLQIEPGVELRLRDARRERLKDARRHADLDALEARHLPGLVECRPHINERAVRADNFFEEGVGEGESRVEVGCFLEFAPAALGRPRHPHNAEVVVKLLPCPPLLICVQRFLLALGQHAVVAHDDQRLALVARRELLCLPQRRLDRGPALGVDGDGHYGDAPHWRVDVERRRAQRVRVYANPRRAEQHVEQHRPRVVDGEERQPAREPEGHDDGSGER